MWKYNGRTIRTGKGWTDDNGVQHPANWHVWSATEKAAAGLTEVVEETPPDSRLYDWSQNSDGTITKTAKSLADVPQTDGTGEAIIGKDGNPVLDINGDPIIDGTGDPILDDDGNQLVTRGVKWNLKQAVKEQQGSLLAQTDWAVIRKADNGTAIPSNIQIWRASIRTKATEMETAIDNATNTDAVAALFLMYTTNEDGSVTKSGILYDWPELGD